MKKHLTFLLLCISLFIIGTTTTSCSKKSGCPYNEYTEKDQSKLGKKRGKSNLFPKHMRKKRKN